MSSDKPSKNEDEYFARQELELIEQQRKRRETEQKAAERRSHFMKCPKDGYDIATETVSGIQIERCPECGGVWLDANEIDALLAKEKTGLIGRVFRDISASLRGSKEEG